MHEHAHTRAHACVHTAEKSAAHLYLAQGKQGHREEASRVMSTRTCVHTAEKSAALP